VLLDKTPTDGTNTEKKAANNIGLAGFEVIDAIKQKVGTNASCADIVAFAARDAADILSGGKIFYTLPGGRKDGVVSSAAAADANLPHPNFDFDQLRDNFDAASRRRSFTVEELVVLSGAHSIGVAHLSSYQDRLGPDSTPIDSDYQAALNKTTPLALLKSGQNPTVPNNARDGSDAFQKDAAYDPVAMGVNPKRGVLDNSYYHNNLVNKVLFKSD
jgi:peroxidase